MTTQVREAIIAEGRAGKSRNALSLKYGIGITTVRRVLLDAGVPKIPKAVYTQMWRTHSPIARRLPPRPWWD